MPPRELVAVAARSPQNGCIVRNSDVSSSAITNTPQTPEAFENLGVFGEGSGEALLQKGPPRPLLQELIGLASASVVLRPDV